ncbi:NTP transferase domain-containing protein [Scytonema sp. NUACC26]|uniref:nucleotidyltransferase family protein n=1 Tax=Scytonema sp. NUACC26 TaxID=3140176 RepID=UPI0034DCBAA4
MSSSIRVGMKALFNATQNLEAVVLTLCDQSFIFTGLINQLINTYFLTRKKIIATEYAETLGVPALFSSTVLPELMSLPGTVGAKHIIRKYPHISVPFPAGAIDIDTPFNYEKLSITLQANGFAICPSRSINSCKGTTGYYFQP